MNDKWEFKFSNLRKWRWQRIASDGEVVGSAPRSYANKVDCEKNAQRNGWVPEFPVAQNILVGEENKQETPKFDVDGSSLGNDRSVSVPDQGSNDENNYRVKRDSRQRKMIVLIASILGLILVVVLLILLKSDDQVALSDNNRLTTSRGIAPLVIDCVSIDEISLKIRSRMCVPCQREDADDSGLDDDFRYRS